jgi:hypothetical protein
MPGEGLTHGPRATKKHAAEPQVKPTSGIPCTMALRLIRDLPGAPGFLATVVRISSSANLASASGCQDHATSPSQRSCSSARDLRAATPIGHHIPHPTFVTIAIHPSHEAGRGDQTINSAKAKVIYFYPKGWTRAPNQSRPDRGQGCGFEESVRAGGLCSDILRTGRPISRYSFVQRHRIVVLCSVTSESRSGPRDIERGGPLAMARLRRRSALVSFFPYMDHSMPARRIGG